MLVLLDWDKFSPSSAIPDEAMLGFDHVRRTRLSISRRDFLDKERRTRWTPWPPALSSTWFSLTREREKRGRKLKFYLRNWLVPEKSGVATAWLPGAHPLHYVIGSTSPLPSLSSFHSFTSHADMSELK